VPKPEYPAVWMLWYLAPQNENIITGNPLLVILSGAVYITLIYNLTFKFAYHKQLTIDTL
jgi:hypothetical protein